MPGMPIRYKYMNDIGYQVWKVCTSVLSGCYVGGVAGAEPGPQTKIFSHQFGDHPQPVGVKCLNLRKIEHWWDV